MRRRLLIAKALVHEPKVLFLDEPTAGVDVELRRALWAYVRTLRDRGTTVVLTTHYLEEAEALADRIGIIDRGRAAAWWRRRRRCWPAPGGARWRRSTWSWWAGRRRSRRDLARLPHPALQGDPPLPARPRADPGDAAGDHHALLRGLRRLHRPPAARGGRRALRPLHRARAGADGGGAERLPQQRLLALRHEAAGDHRRRAGLAALLRRDPRRLRAGGGGARAAGRRPSPGRWRGPSPASRWPTRCWRWRW